MNPRNSDNLGLVPFNSHNPSTKNPSFSHFNAFLKKLFKMGRIHTSIVYRVGTVKGELQNPLLFFFFPLCFATCFFMGAMVAAEAEKKKYVPSSDYFLKVVTG